MRAFSGLAAVAAPLVLLVTSTSVGPAAAADIETEPRAISSARDIETEPRAVRQRPTGQRATSRRAGDLQASVQRYRDIETEPRRRTARDIETEPRR